jgi:hypothetical protein
MGCPNTFTGDMFVSGRDGCSTEMAIVGATLCSVVCVGGGCGCWSPFIRRVRREHHTRLTQG